MPNQARGEVALVIDGATRKLCVTLGALAQLEAAFDVASFTQLGERLEHLNAHDLLIVLAALLGADGMSVQQLAAARIDAKAAAAAIGEAFRIAFGDAV